MEKAKISEIFRSIQGEGLFIGVRQVFVRFHGCNIHCAWCDTENAISKNNGKFDVLTAKQLYNKVIKLSGGCHSLSLTGGEPLLQKDFIKDSLVLLKRDNIKVYLETNGILFKELKEVINGIDFISMDIKLPSSTKCKAFWHEHSKFLDIAVKKKVFIKTVVSNQTKKEDIIRAVKLVAKHDPGLVFILQPDYNELSSGALKKCIGFHDICLKYIRDVRVIAQMHKYLDLR